MVSRFSVVGIQDFWHARTIFEGISLKAENGHFSSDIIYGRTLKIYQETSICYVHRFLAIHIKKYSGFVQYSAQKVGVKRGQISSTILRNLWTTPKSSTLQIPL